MIPQSDGAGEIDAVGAGVPASRVGERVWIWNGQWKRPYGTAAEYIVLPAAQAVRLPASTSYEAGACLGIPALTAWQALDLAEAGERLALLHELCPLDFPEYVIAAEHGQGLEELKNSIYAALGVIRVYTKLPTHKEADFDRPFTLRHGGTVHDVAELVHKDIAATLKHARIWGSSVHDGTVVKGDHVLHDRDIVELHA